MDVAASLHGLEMQQSEPASRKQRDLTMLNLEDLGMSEIEPRRQPLAAIAAPAPDDQWSRPR